MMMRHYECHPRAMQIMVKATTIKYNANNGTSQLECSSSANQAPHVQKLSECRHVLNCLIGSMSNPLGLTPRGVQSSPAYSGDLLGDAPAVSQALKH